MAGVHLYNGSFGLLQVGIPPETIKTYMSKVPNFVVACAVVHPPCSGAVTHKACSSLSARGSVVQGQPVPHIYVLPPRLFVGAVNFGEVEFPIYFNFFIKKAFQNPDLRGAFCITCVCGDACAVLLLQ